MRQATLASVSFERYGKTTRRGAFLAEMERVVPWQQLCALIEPVYGDFEESHLDTVTEQPVVEWH